MANNNYFQRPMSYHGSPSCWSKYKEWLTNIFLWSWNSPTWCSHNDCQQNEYRIVYNFRGRPLLKSFQRPRMTQVQTQGQFRSTLCICGPCRLSSTRLRLSNPIRPIRTITSIRTLWFCLNLRYLSLKIIVCSKNVPPLRLSQVRSQIWPKYNIYLGPNQVELWQIINLRIRSSDRRR